ncbi:WXG100 family type VII secretion target [Streptomyces sp. LaBMicrA B280]|uniref:WXG100 family type VII secretion target n=1 Tax=Streptomyces sp. LaBMicrA B280 TaxID=3391001 RepID=UPI003BA5852E
MSVADKAREIVQDMTGMWWPAADEDGLRHAAKAWRDFADDVEDVTSGANNAARTIIEHNKGEAISAFADPYWRRYYYDKRGWLKDLADAARDMAKALDAYADAVHGAKKKLEHELEIVGATLVAGTLLAVFTAGLSTEAAAAAAASVADVAVGLGIAVTEEIAAIAGTTLATAAFAGVESVAVDLAVTQPVSIALGESKGLSLDEAGRTAVEGMLYGGMSGAAGRATGVVAENGFEAVFGDSLRVKSAALDQMGKSRTWNLLRGEDSKVPVPPGKPGDYELVSGDPVYFGKSTTTIGYDQRTLNNLQRVARMPGVHDVVVHGTNEGVFLPGRVNMAGKTLTDFEVHPNNVVDAIRSNPDYRGGPVRLVSCHSGADAKPPELPLAQSVANELGVPVYAPTNRVGTSPDLGLNQTPTIGNNGYWRTYLPLHH